MKKGYERCENCLFGSYIKDRGWVCCINEEDSGMVYDVFSDESCDDFTCGGYYHVSRRNQ